MNSPKINEIHLKEMTTESENAPATAAAVPPDHGSKEDNNDEEADGQQNDLDESSSRSEPQFLSQSINTMSTFYDLREKSFAYMNAFDWPGLRGIVEQLPYARQERYCKNMYDGLAGKSQARRNTGSDPDGALLMEAHPLGAKILTYAAMTSWNVMQVRDQLLVPAWIADGAIKKLETLGGKRVDALSDLQEDHQIALVQFNESLQSLFECAQMLNGKPDDDCFVRGMSMVKRQLSACGMSQKGKRKKPNLLVPGPNAEEKGVTQPFLLAVVESLGNAIDNAPISASSREETRISSSAPLQPKHVAGKSIAANHNFIFLSRDDDFLKIPVKGMKGIMDYSPSYALKYGTHQVLRQLAKYVFVGFNFAGIGVDTQATGIVLTAAYVDIIQLRLDNAGTRDIGLTQWHTECLPLLTKENFDKWTGSCANDWKEFRDRLYPQDVESSVPTGLVALCNLMTSTRKDLFGPAICVSDCLEDLIGFSDLNSVYAGRGRYRGCVVKLSRCGQKKSIDREARVLKALLDSVKGDAPDFIPKFIENTVLGLHFGGVDRYLPALILSPCAVSVEQHIASLESVADRNVAVQEIGHDIVSALAFVHGKGFIHNDVSASNILVNTTTTKDKKARGILIDFAFASSISECKRGVVGTWHYLHQEIFRQYPNKKWTPKAEFDLSGLAFSMADLSNQKKHSWESFEPCEIVGLKEKKLEKWAKERSKIAWSFLNATGFPEQPWKTWCFDI